MGLSKIQLRFKNGKMNTFHLAEVTRIRDGWHLAGYPAETFHGRTVAYRTPLPTTGYLHPNWHLTISISTH